MRRQRGFILTPYRSYPSAAYPSVISTTKNGAGGSGSYTIALGTFAAGDLLVVCMFAVGGSGNNLSSVTSGWTHSGHGSYAANDSWFCYWKVAVGGDTLSITMPSGGSFLESYVYRIQDFNVSGGLGFSSTAGYNPPSATVPGGPKNALGVVVVAQQSNNITSFTPSSGYTSDGIGFFSKSYGQHGTHTNVSSIDPAAMTVSPTATFGSICLTIAVPAI